MARIMGTDEQAIRTAAIVLAEGKLVAIPTETVYGLAADATNGEAVASIFEAKGRPHFNPLICHVSDIAMAERYAVIDPLVAAAHRCVLAGATDARASFEAGYRQFIHWSRRDLIP